MHPSRQRTPASLERFFQYSLLGLVATGFFALAGTRSVGPWTFALTSLALALRALIIAGRIRLPISGRIDSALALGCVGFYPFDYYFFSRDFFIATLHAICFLAAIKVLTASSNRDYLYTAAVAFIQLVAAALLSFEASFFAWLALYILFAIAAFTSAEIRRSLARRDVAVHPAGAGLGWRLTLVTCAVTCGILVITGGLFLVVPRTARAAALLFPYAPRLTGYSNVVDLGNFGAIGTDNRPVMHISSYGADLPRGLKWRGTALSRFDGRRWSEPPLAATDVQSSSGSAKVADRWQLSRRDGRRMLYRVDVNSSDTGTLFIAGTPEYINFYSPRLIRTAEDSFRALPVTGEGLRYDVSAHWGSPLPVELSPAERARWLQLPLIDTRIWTLARRWAGAIRDPGERAVSIQQHLRAEFHYSLESSARPVRDPLARFLFVTKTGYCEYFASAMAVMLRTLGVPSRVVTGFQSGYFNEVSGQWVVRASDAHAWVEAWIEGLGWVTFDPTPIARAPRRNSVMARINMYFDAADGMWQQWVMAYDLGHQAVLAAKFEGVLRAFSQTSAPSGLPWKARLWSGAKTGGAWALTLATIATLLFFGWPRLWRELCRRYEIRRIFRGEGSASDATVLYGHMLDALAKRGYQKPTWFTPLEFASILPPAEREPVARFTDLYNAVRFGNEAAATAEMAEILAGWNSATTG